MTNETYEMLFERAVSTFPANDDPFAVALWSQNLEEAAYALGVHANRLFNEYVMFIYEHGETSTKYEILFPEELVHIVDCEALAVHFPTVYQDLAFVPANDAARILGRKALYNQCMQYDPDRTKRYTRVNLGDLLKVLGQDEAKECVTEYGKPLKPIVTEVNV